MSDAQKRGGRRNRSGKSSLKTRSGATLKVNRSITDKIKSRRDNRARRRANRLATLPKSRFKRTLFRLHPKHLAAYWFSRDGLIMALKLTGVGVVVIFVVLVGLFAYFRKDLPDLTNISGGNLGGSITYYDRTGTVVLWQDYNAVKRVAVQSDQISTYMKDATVAIEDKNFYHEGAISVSGIARAGLHDIFGGSGGGLQGASTITEQVVKLNENWNGNRSISTKVKEIILAVDLEREYTKSDILTGYLNVAPYGGVDYGAQAAAQDYFGVNASQLTLAQSAFLAAIPQAPGIYSPYSSPQFNSAASEDLFDQSAVISRQQYILDQMVKQGYITQAQDNAAKAVDIMSEILPLQNKYSGIQDPYFVLSAKQWLENKFGASTINRGGWKVITTLNVPLQNLANTLVAKNLPLVEKNHGDEEAMVAEDVKTGQVDALVGGVNFNNPDYGQINYAETPLPPGSSFKPYDYSTLINDTDNAGAGSLLYDVKEPLPGYPCTTGNLQPLQGGNCLEDYDFIYPGAEELRYALAGSRNIPAVKAMLSVIPNQQCEDNVVSGCVPSINKVISTADAMMDVPNAYQCYSDTGLTDPTQCYSSSAIGDGAYLTIANHANGLATLARLGQAIPQTFVLKITNSDNNVIYNWTQPKPTQVIQPDTAYILDNILDDPDASYLPASQKFQSYDGWNIAVKTGTTNNEFDALMTAWTTQYSVVSWVGYHSRNVALTAGLSETITEPLTRTFMQDALSMLNEKPVNWVQPPGIKVLPAYKQTKHIDYGDVEPGPSTDLYPSWYTGSAASSGSKTESQTIDKVSGDIATSCTPSLAKETNVSSDENEFSIDLFWPLNQSSSTANTSAATATDTVHNCSDNPPSVTLTVTDLDPTDPSPANNCNGSCTITITVSQGTHLLSDPTNYPQFPGTVNFSVNGTQVESFDIDNIAGADCSTTSPPNNCTISFTYTPTASGTESFSAQVIDSVLYQDTDSSTVTTTPPSNSSSNPAPSNSQTSGQG